MLIALLSTFLLVFANGFFVAAEFALARLRPGQVADAERDGRRGAKSARHAVEHVDSYLAACQLGITLASIGLGVVGKPVFEKLLEPVLGQASSIAGFALAAALAFLIITLLHVVIGELAPKSWAIAKTSTVSLLLAPPMRLFYILTKPAVESFNGMGNLLLKPFGIPPAREAGHAPHSEDELRSLLRQSGDQGIIERFEQEIGVKALLFGDLRAREVMQPRQTIDYVSIEDTLEDVVEKAREGGHTRLPLTDESGSLEDAVGLLHIKDLISALLSKQQVLLQSIARPLPRVGDGIRIGEIFRNMRPKKLHMALVTDEHGTVVGLLTLEDVLEELVGEIEDEFDLAPAPARTNGNLEFLGETPLRAAAEELGLEFEEHFHETTLGGQLVEALGRVPEAGETVEWNGYCFEILEAEDALILKLKAVGPRPDSLDFD
jgi:CBS domain containing-hemolysin-like protein